MKTIHHYLQQKLFVILIILGSFSPVNAQSIVSWETHTADDVFMYHANGNMMIGRVNQMPSEENGYWTMVAGLSDSDGVSFRSKTNNNSYLVFENGSLKLGSNNNTTSFKDNATFYVRTGMADEFKMSFESYSQPGKYIRHKNSVVYLEEIVSNQDRLDATFSAYTGDMSDKNWSKAPGRIWTPWGEKINDPDQVLREYPRPQMKRDSNWIILNGLWRCKKGNVNDAVPFGQNLDRDILVPFPVEAALSGIKQHWERMWYRKVFTIPSDWKGQKVNIHFGAIDWESEIFVNGQRIMTHRGGYDPFSVDITNYLNGGSNELIVRVFDPTEDGSQPIGKQEKVKFNNTDGIFYTPTSGIWQTVWLESVPNTYIKNIKMVPNIDDGTLSLTVNTSENASGLTVDIKAKDNGAVIGSISGGANTEHVITIPDQKLWSPDTPFLYDLNVELKLNGVVIDEIESYFAMRKISLGKRDGKIVMMFNNEFLFQMGPLDQGYWPDGNLTPPSEEAILFDLEGMKDLGYNMVRKHIKVEPARWYYHTDRLGLIVWQDMINGFRINTPQQRAQHELELDRMIDALWNVPSIIMWVVWNEQWGMYDQVRLTNEVMAKDPSRLANGNSACCGGSSEGGHIKDYHYYSAPNCPAPDPDRALANGEYGGLVLVKEDHMWDPNYYSRWALVVEDDDEFTDRFVDYCNMNIAMRDINGMSASVFTQWTDVEGELNGNYTYDRKVFKGDYDRIKEALISTYNNNNNAGMNSPLGYVAWASYNIAGQFIRHINSEGRIAGNVTPRDDAFWKMVPGLAGTGVSFQSKQFPNRYFRHRGGQVFLEENDNSSLFAGDATFIVKPGLADNSKFSFQSYNFPNRYIRHTRSTLYTDEINNDIGRADATFEPYTGNEIFTWYSHNNPGFAIRHEGGRAKIDNDVDLAEDGQWQMVYGLAGEGVSFRSTNFPNRYLRHRDEAVYLDDFQNNQLFREDATFLLREGLDDPAKYSFESFNYRGNYIQHTNLLLYSRQVFSNEDRADATFDLNGVTLNNFDDSYSGNRLLAYPNPSKNRLYVKGLTATAPVLIFDIFGKEITQVSIKNNSDNLVEIDISPLRKGVYFLQSDGLQLKFIKE